LAQVHDWVVLTLPATAFDHQRTARTINASRMAGRGEHDYSQMRAIIDEAAAAMRERPGG
jgi:molecular chaperone DnaK (HSP70)